MTEQHVASATPVSMERSRYCRKCGYDLRGTTLPRCPECGKPFDPTNPKTFRRRPIRPWVRHVQRAALAMAAMLLVLAAVWGWFYWGWWQEHRALADMRAERSVGSEPLLPWLRDRLGPAGFVLDRVVGINLEDRADLSDFSPLAKFTELRWLHLGNTRIADLAPLARLTKLQILSLIGTSVKDLSLLRGHRHLRLLGVPQKMVTEEQIRDFQRARPGCTVARE